MILLLWTLFGHVSTLVKTPERDKNRKKNEKEDANAIIKQKCSKCDSLIENVVTLSCLHIFCNSCSDSSSSLARSVCPLCQLTHFEQEVNSSYENSEINQNSEVNELVECKHVGCEFKAGRKDIEAHENDPSNAQEHLQLLQKQFADSLHKINVLEERLEKTEKLLRVLPVFEKLSTNLLYTKISTDTYSAIENKPTKTTKTNHRTKTNNRNKYIIYAESHRKYTSEFHSSQAFRETMNLMF